MNAKKLVGAIVAAFVILFVAGFLVHGVWLGDTYRSMRQQSFSFRSEAALQHKVWIVWVSDLLYSILFAWVYARGMERRSWLGQGVRFGVLMSLFTIVPSALNDYVVYNLSHMLVLDWICAGFVTLILMGIAVAAILKAPPAAA